MCTVFTIALLINSYVKTKFSHADFLKNKFQHFTSSDLIYSAEKNHLYFVSYFVCLSLFTPQNSIVCKMHCS